MQHPVDDIVISPCVRRCCLDEKEICLGCFRSMSEICAWAGSNSDARRQILKNATIRQQQHSEHYEE